MAEAQRQIDAGHATVLVSGASWHVGVVGIVAGRIKERFNRPACVAAITDGMAKGSGRSVPGIDLGAAIIAARAHGLLTQGGGHSMAAGFGLHERDLPAFHAFLDERLAAASMLPAAADLAVEGAVSLAGCTMELAEQIQRMAPFGAGNPEPVLVLPRVLAAVLMLPLLGFFSAVIAIIGGAVLGNFTLDIPFLTFLTRIKEVVPLTDLWVGLIKGPVFGLIIALTGCYQGLQVSGNSEQVGLRTTLAVVQAIFVVIVLDAFFAVFFTAVGWK